MKSSCVRRPHSRRSAFASLVCSAAIFAAQQVSAQLIHVENFEGNASGYSLDEPEYVEQTPENGWSPGIWGLNTQGSQIGLAANAPAKRAAILWNHEGSLTADTFTSESLDVWLSLTDWSLGITNPADRASKRIAIVPGAATEAVAAVQQRLVAGGYSASKIIEQSDYLSIAPSNTDLAIFSSETSVTLPGLAVPIISFRSETHDDNAIAGIGAVLDFQDALDLSVPQAVRNHPALGPNGTDGVLRWTTGPARLEGIGITHNGGKTLAQVEDPMTGELAPALFVIEKGAPLLGAFNPTPEGKQYIVGSALNKFGSMAERTLRLKPVNVAGKNDVNVTVALASVTSDFETGDYMILEVDPDGDGPAGMKSLVEFYGVDNAGSPCHKGLSNDNGVAGSICLTPEFKDYTFNVPAGATNLVFQMRGLSTWGNEIFALDNIRIHSGKLLNGDFNSNGSLDVGDLDLLTDGQISNNKSYDLTGDGQTDFADRQFWVRDLKKTWMGDSDLNGVFNTADFVTVFQEGKFETGTSAQWAQGDWNGDRLFNTSDFVVAFQDGGFEQGPRAAVASVPEPSSALLATTASLVLAQLRRRRRV